MRRMPTLGEFVPRYLEEDTAHLAATVKKDREGYLSVESETVAELGEHRLDEITAAVPREWWSSEAWTRKTKEGEKSRTASEGTKRHRLNTLAQVLAYARDIGVLDEAHRPVEEFREQLRRRRTKGDRAQSLSGRDVRPIENPADIERILKEAREEGPEALVCVLLMLDAGLRLGEALAVRWGSVAPGANESDTGRHIVVRENRLRGGEAEAPKSGRERVVKMSRRLRRALEVLYRAQLQPSPEVVVLAEMDPSNFRSRAWRRVLERAKVGHRRPKDLRDTYASQLLTAGIQVAYVSRQLGHADLTTTIDCSPRVAALRVALRGAGRRDDVGAVQYHDAAPFGLAAGASVPPPQPTGHSTDKGNVHRRRDAGDSEHPTDS
jgi:integrase